MSALAAKKQPPKPIKALFADGEALLSKLENGNADADDATTCVRVLNDAWAAATALGLFPAGCCYDDVATADLRYALIPDLRARARSRVRALDGAVGRLALVERCRMDRARFLELAASLDPEVASHDDDDTDDGRSERDPSPADVRKQAIERYETKKRCEAALATARAALKAARTTEEVDELRREYVIAELRAAAAACKEAIASDDKELDLLRTMARGAPQRPVRPPQNADAAWLLGARPGGQNGGLRVLRMGHDEKGDVRGCRETVRSGVFRPSHRAPTMTIEEFADIEISDAMDRDARQKAAAKHKPTIAEDTRRRDQLEEASDEEDTERYDQARYRSEAWANWLEAHPRGSGNKGVLNRDVDADMPGKI